MRTTEQDVIAYLKDNPDFLSRNSDLVKILHPPMRNMGSSVPDFQTAMIKNLQAQVEETESLAYALINNSKDNLSSIKQMHDCVLAMLQARSLEQLLDALVYDLTAHLGLDVISICFESDEPMPLHHPAFQLMEIGTIKDLLTNGSDYQLYSDIHGHPSLFGARALSVRSQAIGRLHISPDAPDAIIAFGSRDSETFSPEQTTDLMAFLSQVVAILIRVWMDLPDYEEGELGEGQS